MKRQGLSDRAVERVRRKLAAIDRSLVRALRQRERAQWRLLERKVRLGLPLTDVRQEERVRGRARAWSEALGGDPALAETVVLAAVLSGKTRFATGRSENAMPEPASSVRTGPRRRVLHGAAPSRDLPGELESTMTS